MDDVDLGRAIGRLVVLAVITLVWFVCRQLGIAPPRRGQSPLAWLRQGQHPCPGCGATMMELTKTCPFCSRLQPRYERKAGDRPGRPRR